MTPAPYWKLPGAYTVVPRQRKFKANMELLDGELANAINSCLADRVEEVSAWQDKCENICLFETVRDCLRLFEAVRNCLKLFETVFANQKTGKHLPV